VPESAWTNVINATLHPYYVGICRPNTISNELLYRRCDTQPLSEIATRARWRVLRHVLHMPSDTPAQLAMQFALKGATEYKGRRGHHQTNLLETIRAGLSRHQVEMRSKADIKILRELATDKSKWRALRKKD